MNDPFWDAARAMAGCPRTEKVSTITYVDGENPEFQHHPLTPPPNSISNPVAASFSGFPHKLLQGAIATGAALGVVIGAGLNINFLASAFVGGVGAGLGSVAASVNKKDPKEEAKKVLLAAGDRYAANADLEKLTTVKEILGYLEGR